VRAPIISTREGRAAASSAHDDAPMPIDPLASLIRRSIEEQTFAAEDQRAGDRALQLVDDFAARYGDLHGSTLVGLIEPDWPEHPQRNIFYPATLLQALGWPSEREWRGAAEARFLDLLTSPAERMALSTITL